LTVLLPVPFFDQCFSLCSGEAKMKKLRRLRQADFLGTSSPDSFLPDRFALRGSCAWLGWGAGGVDA